MIFFIFLYCEALTHILLLFVCSDDCRGKKDYEQYNALNFYLNLNFHHSHRKNLVSALVFTNLSSCLNVDLLASL